jgi:hypothetical protein
VELAPVVGAEAPATGLSVEEPASAAEARRRPLNPRGRGRGEQHFPRAPLISRG